MALDRQSIEKKDFPIGRRGYDPDAVDSHLASLADEIDELKRSARRRSDTLASSASEQVRTIVEAAENSASEIQRQAEEEAREIRAEASSEAQGARQQATEQAREYVGKVSESTAVMLQRLDAMEAELGALVESLRTGSNRLNADLQLLEGNLTEVRDSVAPRPRFEAEPDAEPSRGTAGGREYDKAATLPEAAEPDEIDESDEIVEEPAVGGVTGDNGAEDVEGARLIALNMALNGTPREETERYLTENFELRNRAALLDEVYASVEG